MSAAFIFVRTITIIILLTLLSPGMQAQSRTDLFVDISDRSQRIEEIDTGSMKITVTYCDLAVDMYTSDDDVGFDLQSLMISWPGQDSRMNLLEDADDPGAKPISPSKTSLVISLVGDCSDFLDPAHAELTFVGQRDGSTVDTTEYSVQIRNMRE